MKPQFDITAKNSFAVWESGSWKDKQGIGSAILAADQDSNKLQVIFDKDPTKTQNHALMYANVGYVLAGCFAKRQGPNLNFHLELTRIDSLTTRQVQVDMKAVADTSVLYMSRKLVPLDSQNIKLLALADMPELPSLPNAYQMMELAIEKALTPLPRQRIFYGLPRLAKNDDES